MTGPHPTGPRWAHPSPVAPVAAAPGLPLTIRDVTVLVLSTPIGTSTLTVAPTGPERGTWYTVFAMRTDSRDTDPYRASLRDHYDVLAMGNAQGDDPTRRPGEGQGAGDDWFLSGLQPSRAAVGQIDYFHPGASGAPLLTVPTTPGTAPQVIGDLVGGNAGHLDPASLAAEFGATIVGPAEALPPLPKAGYATPAPMIVAAIAATNALQPPSSVPSPEPAR
jgi:hypothetical protein